MECLNSIGLSPRYVNYVSRSRITALVDPAWLEGAASGVVKPLQLSLTYPEEHLQRSSPDPPPPWRRVSIKVLVKKPGVKVCRPPQLRSMSHHARYCDLLAYIAQENYQNLWKFAWERYEERGASGCIHGADGCDSTELQDYDAALERLVGELYGDRLKLSSSTTVPTVRLDGVQPAYAVLQMDTAFCIVQPFVMYSLRELQTFSQAALGNSSAHLLFLCYQLLRLAHCCHTHGLTLGITSDDQVLMAGDGRDGCYWMVAMPRIGRQLAAVSVHVTATDARNNGKPMTRTTHRLECSESYEAWCDGWIKGVITNFDYLMFLNKLAGRRRGDPNHHPVLPWIMDFTLQDGCYRDLCKSKFRLNKGDEQLDQMYTATLDHADLHTISSLGMSHDSAGSATSMSPAASTSPVTVPHHVSAILSDITYYTYMARRTPREILCAHVRPKWVPNEYPASIERLQAWTPDECIPEFFTDPMIFVSVHDDLPDLKVPAWAGTPERFVELHMQALESEHISQSLHHWIDLTFGYKLRGDAAVEAKNVCLQLVDGHRQAENHGIVQLFTRPHPARLLCSKNSTAPPRPPVLPRATSLPSTTSNPMQSLNGILSSPDNDIGATTVTATELSGSPAPTIGSIMFPETFNPLDILDRAERVWDQGKQPPTTSNALPNEKNQDSVEDLVDQDIMGIGCIVVKAIFPLDTAAIAYSDSTTTNDCSGLRSYYRILREVARRKLTDIPKPLLNIVQVLMNLQGHQGSSAGVNQCSPTISVDGLPPICPGLLMHPLLQLVPFPEYYDALYNLACIQRRMETVIASAAQLVERSSLSSTSNGMEAITHFCGGVLGECLKTHAAFFTEHGPHLPLTGLELAMPYVLKLMRCDSELGGHNDDSAATAWLQRQHYDFAVQAAWTLFPYVSQMLGPRKTHAHLVPVLLGLYDSLLVPLRTIKCIKLYHKSFVQQLCAQLSLESFLAAGFLLRVAQGAAGLRDFDVTQSTCAYSAPEELHVEPAITADEPSSGTDYGTNEDDLAEEAEEAAEENEMADQMPEQDPGVGSGADSDVDEPQTTEEAGNSSGLKPTSFGLDNGDEEEGVVKDQPARTAPHAPGHVGWLPREQAAAVSDQAAEYNVRHVAVDCMSWLCERLGPVLAVRHASEALLQTLKDCYNVPHAVDSVDPEEVPSAARLFMSNKYVVGDSMAAGVLQCLINMAVLYGEQFLLIHFFNYIVYVIQAFDGSFSSLAAGCKGGSSSSSSSGSANHSLEAGLLACITLLAHVVACLTETKLLEVLEKSIMGDLLTPLIHTVSNRQRLFPTGVLFRSLAAFRIVDVMVLVSTRIGFDQTRQYMCPVLKQFFSSFSVHASSGSSTSSNPANPSAAFEGGRPQNRDVSEYVQIKQSALDRNNFYVGSPVMIGMSPSPSSSELAASWEPVPEDVAEELRLVFSHELAQYSYVRFCKLAGGIFLQTHLVNEELVSRLSAEYDEQLAAAANIVTATSARGDAGNSMTTWFVPPLSEPSTPAVEVVGNKLSFATEKERQEPKALALDGTNELKAKLHTRSEMMTNSVRHLKGNWLAYCEHEWGLDKSDTAFRYKQIHLQDFCGHAASVRSMQVLENENSFITGSKDKTVKLWALRNVGDGNGRCNCQYTYSGHKRTVLSVAYMESVKLIASLDGSVHLWDPFFGTCVRQYEVSRIPGDTASAARVSGLGASAMQPLFAPSPLLIAATAECSLRLLDVRVRRFVQELRTWQHGAASTAGTISGLAVSQNNIYVAAASTSGYVSVLDLRTGFPQGAWKAHDGEILQIRSFNDKCFVTSSMDSVVTMWRYDDAKPVINLRGHSDPVRCICFHNNSMISATTANKIGVHSSVSQQPIFYCEKLRADTFKGVLTSMAILPSNKLLLLGADNGTISLFA